MVKKAKKTGSVSIILFSVVALSLSYFAYTFNGKATGQVFIVTKGSSSIKLSNIEIFSIESTQFKKYLSMKRSDLWSCPEDGNKKIYDECIIKTVTEASEVSKTRTRSNSDGYFEIDVPRNQKIVLLASASRTLPFGEKENYLWAIDVNLGFDLSKSVQMSNNNLFIPKNYRSALEKWM